MALTALDHLRRRSSRAQAIAWSSSAPRRRWLLLHLVILTACFLFTAAQATGNPIPAPTIDEPAILAADGPDPSVDTESSSKPAPDRTPTAVPPASKRQRTRPAQKDRVLPNPPEYPPLGRELASASGLRLDAAT